MKKLRIGVMGCANIAIRSVIPAIKALPQQYELIAVSSRNAEKAKEVARIFDVESVTGYENLVDREDIDVVYMPLPTGLHEEWGIRLLNAGKHILIEKSFALSYESASKLTAIANTRQLLLMENFMFQYHSQHQWVWHQINRNELGQIRLFRSQFGFPPLDKNNFRYDVHLGGGALLDAGAYTVKASQWFLGNSLSVAAATLYIDSGRDVDIYGNATLINEKGQVSQISFGFDNFYQCNYEFWGSTGRLVAERAFTPKPDEKPVILFERNGIAERISMKNDNHFQNLLIEFHARVTGKEYNKHLEEILAQSKILTAIKQQATKIML